ncbi:MAG: hypothetical protein AAF825_01955 [Pseudomonadota bacterium]
MKNTIGVAAAGAAIACVVAGSAAATPVSLTYNGAAYGGYRNVTIQEAPVTPAPGNVPANVGAGGFDMTDTSGPLGDFIAWCLDIAHWLGTGNSSYAYEITTTPFTNSYGLLKAEQDRVQGYFDANYQDFLNNANQSTSAGFQLGLWEVLYDDDYSLTLNDTQVNTEFRATTGNTATRNAANGFLANAETAGVGGTKVWNLTFLESKSTNPSRQNLVMATEDTGGIIPLPVPGAGLLLLGGLAAFGAIKRARRVA